MFAETMVVMIRMSFFTMTPINLSPPDIRESLLDVEFLAAMILDNGRMNSTKVVIQKKRSKGT